MAINPHLKLPGQSPEAASSTGRTGYWLALGVAVLAIFALPLDLPVASYLKVHPLRGDLNRLVMLSEAFSFGLTALMILGLAWLLDPAKRKPWRWALLATILAGMMANLAKMCLARVRPHSVEELLNQQLTTLPSVRDTFVTWLPSLDFESGMQSFPSAHATTAAALAVALGWLYPRGRVAFALIAALACFQRMASQAHYMSDVLAGAALGTFAATLVVRVAEAKQATTASQPTAGRIESELPKMPPVAKAS